METVIYFVRHATPDYNDHDDFNRPLTEKGRADRAKVTEALKNKGITRAFSSPYVRSKDTIKPLCDLLGLCITTVEDLRERAVSGEWIEIDSFMEFTKKQWADHSYKLDGGESLLEVQQRNIKALKDILSACQGQTIVIGTHGMALSCIMNYFDKSFGFDEYEHIRPIMPYIVKGTVCGALAGLTAKMEHIELF